MSSYFITGFPGFLATNLVKELIRDDQPIDELHFLVLPEMLPLAKRQVQSLLEDSELDPDQIILHPGDITVPNLGLKNSALNHLRERIEIVFHLAAIYDLAVPESLAHKVNVTGTRMVNEWVQTLPQLKRYTYFSTAYVSGTREGIIYEHELDQKQSFKNHYERTKFEAEVLVQSIIGHIPTTIIRPGIVKGDSRTGETSKFDGPYFMLNFFEQIKYWPFVPYLGSSEAIAQLVPVDYVVKAAIYLTHHPSAVGKTYHLTDPHAYTFHEVYKRLLEEHLGKSPRGVLPISIVEAVLSIPFVRRWLKVEKEALAYFQYSVIYDSSQAERDLAGSGIALPDFMDTVKSMVDYYNKHKQDPSKHIPIR